MKIKSPISIRMLFFLFLLTNYSFSQNCSCEVAKSEDLRNKYKTACFSGNQEMLDDAVAPLEKDTSIYCKQEALNWRATFTTFSSNMELCKKLLDEEKKLLDKSPCLQNQSLYHNVKANYYMHLGQIDSVASEYLKELKILEQLENKSNLANSLSNVSVVFSKMKQFDKQHFYLKKAITLIPEIPDLVKRTNTMAAIARGYSELYEFYKNKSFLDTALVLSNKVLKLTDSIKGSQYIKYEALIVNQLKEYVDGNIKESIKINLDRKRLLNPIFHVRDLYFINELLADRYKENNEYVLANKYLDSAKIYSNKLNDKVSFNWHYTKYEVLKNLGEYREALSNFEQYTQLNDSVQQKERFDKINDLETKYQTELKDAKIISLNQQKTIDDLTIKNKQTLIIWLLALAVVTILAIIFFFRQRSLKNKQKILETEQRLNRARINPHFFFNGMASLQNLSLQEKSTQTTLFISRFAKIMRQSLESTYEELTTVEEEIDFLNQYLEIQKLRYPEKFDFQFYIEDALEINELKLPGMLMQPFVENAIEHGFKDIDYKGKIEITFEEENNKLLITVEDNGKGFKEDDKEKVHKSRAMQIIKDRLYLFNKQHNSDAFYVVSNTESNQSYKIIVTLPKLYS